MVEILVVETVKAVVSVSVYRWLLANSTKRPYVYMFNVVRQLRKVSVKYMYPSKDLETKKCSAYE